MDKKLSKTALGIIIGMLLLSTVSVIPAFSQGCCVLPLAESNVSVQVDNSSAPDFTVPTLDGDSFTLSAQRGKPVVMFVMAYWCATCYKEARELAKLHDKYKDRVVILALDVDPSSTPVGLSKFKARVGNPDYIWAFDKGGKVATDYKLKALETTIIFDPSGNIVFTDYRPTSLKILERELREFLE